METPEIKVSSVEDFKRKSEERKQPKVITLPSGLVVKVLQPELSQLIRNKSIPGELLNAALEMKEDGGKDKQNIGKSLELIDKIVLACLVEPKIAEQPDYENGVIGLEDLADNDKVAIFNLTNESAAGRSDLTTFPK